MIDSTVLLSTEEFRLIRDIISDYCGMYFDDKLKFIVQARLNNRLKIHRLKDFREYYRFLKYERRRDEELQAIIDVLTVNETYFFRGGSQLIAFREEILPELRERNNGVKKLNIWSAGCSTGEEPYTIAVNIIEDGRFNDWDINILGSDISQRVLQVARKGLYRKNSLRCTEDYFTKKYFEEHENGEFLISEKVKRLVSFSSLNLLDSYKVRLVEPMDIIFCRNVLIYFAPDARKIVIENLFNVLKDGGYLLIGHSESLMNVTTSFVLRNLKNDIVYQKPVSSQ